MRCVIEWMLIKLEGTSTTLGHTGASAHLTLDGPGGWTWTLVPRGDGRLSIDSGTVPRAPRVAARVTGRSIDFPAWATGREDWRHHDLSIEGDHDYAVRLLDAISVI
jgi:23S rRNA C2498 (ribose-2'-O)-methylase RlmM